MKRRRTKRRGRPRIATKVLEKALVERAQQLRDNPDIFFPECQDHDDHYLKYKVRFEKIARYSDNEKKLAALARWGDQLSRAFAVSLSIALAKKVPYLATTNVRGREASFVYNRKVRKEILVGVQYYDDPDLRLLAFARIAKLRRLFLYSMKNNFICTGREDKPPLRYVSEVLALTKYPLTRRGESFLCVHCEGEGVPFLRISWLSPGIEVLVCESCAKKENTYQALTRRFLSYDPKRSFRVEIHPNYLCEEGEDCSLNSLTSPPSELVSNYLEGGISDTELIEGHIEHLQRNVPFEERILALGNRCYGKDTASFIDALNPSKVERKALEIVLEKVGGSIVTESATPNKVLMKYWEEYGVDVLESIVGDRSLARSVFDKGNRKRETPAKMLQAAISKAKRKAIESALPEYSGLPPLAAFADRVSRAYKTDGKESAIKEATKETSKDTKIRSVKYAFLLALDSATGREWQFTKEQLDFGRFLRRYAEKLMKSEGEEYHSSLEQLLRASGSTQEI